MRQAGRYMSEYRALRERYSLLDICRTPDLATEVTLQPVRRIEVDAAILFSDLLLPLEPMGIPFDFVTGEGPAIENPLRSEADIGARPPVRAARGAGARARRDPADQARARRPRAADRLRRRAVHARVVRDRGRPLEQLRAHQGADVRPPRRVAPLLRPARRRHRRLPRRADRSRRRRRAGVRLVGRRAERAPTTASSSCRTRGASSNALAPLGVPTIHFGVGTGSILGELREAGGDVIGADWRTPLDEAWERIGFDRAIQGNLDPTLLLGPLDRMFAGDRRSAGARRRPPGPHLQSRPRHPADRRRSSTSRRSRDTCTSKRDMSHERPRGSSVQGRVGRSVLEMLADECADLRTSIRRTSGP